MSIIEAVWKPDEVEGAVAAPAVVEVSATETKVEETAEEVKTEQQPTTTA